MFERTWPCSQPDRQTRWRADHLNESDRDRTHAIDVVYGILLVRGGIFEHSVVDQTGHRRWHDARVAALAEFFLDGAASQSGRRAPRAAPGGRRVAFVRSRTALSNELEKLGQMIFPGGGLWIAWPKRSSGIATTLSDDVVRELALPMGLVDNKVCTIDATWTGLRFVWRRTMRRDDK